MLHRQAVAVGDFNNDGEPDLFVGAPLSDNGTTTTNPANTGLVYIHEGTAMGYAPTQAPVSGLDNPAIDAAEQPGSAIMVLDINADGIEDLFIGASADDTPGIGAGSVYFKLYKYIQRNQSRWRG